MNRDNLGNILLRKKQIDQFQLQSALAHQKNWGRPLGATLVELGFCPWDVVLSALSEQAGLPVVDWTAQKVSKDLATLLPQRIAERCRAVPLGLEGARREVLVVAVAAPALLTTLDELRLAAGKQRLKAMIAGDSDVERALGMIYTSPKTQTSKPEMITAMPSAVTFSRTTPLRQNTILLLGWHSEVVGKLKAILAPAGFASRSATAEEILVADANDLVIAPLQSAEGLVVGGMKFPARLLLIGRNPESEAFRAKSLGAVGYLAAPLDAGELVRAVQAAVGHRPAQPGVLKN